MSPAILNEHDANQGAQSKGEFLGMTGNSGWYLLSSAGSSVMMVIVLWGVLEISLLLCLMIGVVLCLLSVAYVFALKNNKPDHYDTDFFESALIEAGLIELSFGPRLRRIVNPFAESVTFEQEGLRESRKREPLRFEERRTSRAGRFSQTTVIESAPTEMRITKQDTRAQNGDKVKTVPLASYEQLQADFEDTQRQLEEALTEQEMESCDWNR